MANKETQNVEACGMEISLVSSLLFTSLSYIISDTMGTENRNKEISCRVSLIQYNSDVQNCILYSENDKHFSVNKIRIL